MVHLKKYFFILWVLGLSVFAESTLAEDHQGCNDFLKSNEFTNFVTIGADGTFQVSPEKLKTITYSRKVAKTKDDPQDHYDILISSIINPKKNTPPPYLINKIRVDVDDQDRILRIEHTNNYASGNWNGPFYAFDKDTKQKCILTEEGNVNENITTHEKKEWSVFHTKACIDVMGFLKKFPKIETCLKTQNPRTADEAKDCLTIPEQEKQVQGIFDQYLRGKTLAIPPKLPFLSEQLRFFDLQCENNKEALYAISLTKAAPDPALIAKPAEVRPNTQPSSVQGKVPKAQ